MQLVIGTRGLALATILALLSACGGGGGGGSSTGSSGNSANAPTVTVAAPTGVDEGQAFTLDATGSTSPIAGTLTFAWTQTGGPTVQISSPSAGSVTITAPEVSADQNATFSVTVSNGTASASRTVTVPIFNIALSPSFGPAPQEVARLTATGLVQALLGDAFSSNYGMVGVNAVEGGPIAFALLTNSNGNVALSPSPAFSETFQPPVAFAPMRVNLSFVPFATNVGVIEPTANRFRMYAKDPNAAAFSKVFESTVNGPCAVEDAPYYSSIGPLVVGQKAGFSLYSVVENGNSAQLVLAQQLSSGALCALNAPRSTITGGILVGGPRLRDLVAINTTNNSIEVYKDSSNNGVLGYTLKSSTPIQLNTTDALHFVAATKVGNFIDDKFALAAVFSDGKHQGTHRLVVIGLDANEAVVQQTYSWTIGAPSDVIYDSLNGGLVLMVISQDSPQAIMFKTNNPTGAALPLSGPFYWEIGLGATTGVPRRYQALGLDAMYVAYKNKGIVRALR